MSNINILLVFLIAIKYGSCAPMVNNKPTTDVLVIKKYVERGMEISRSMNIIPNILLLDYDDQIALKYYNFYHNLVSKLPPKSLGKLKNSNSIVCFPNNECVDINDIGVYP